MIHDKISGFSDEIAPEIITQFDGLKSLGIKYFEPRGINDKNISFLSEKDARELKSIMNKYDIKASSIGSPIGKIKLSDDFDAHFQVFKNIVKIAKILDCRYIRIFSFYHNGNVWTNEEKVQVISKLKVLIEYARENDIVLLHENEKDIYGDTVNRCLELMKELACENFAAVFDPANFVQSGEDTLNAYDKLKYYIKYVHIKDAKKVSGEVVPAGLGDGNIEKILTMLFKSGFQGFLSLEPHLGSFKGLNDLELDNKMSKLPQGGLGTFTLAFDSLKKILDNI